MKSLIDSINKFENMLKKYPDDIKYTFEFYAFFKSLNLVQHNSDYIPIIELGTIFKYKKPNIFFDMRKYSGQSKIINLITSVEMDLEKSIEKIANIKEQSF